MMKKLLLFLLLSSHVLASVAQTANMDAIFPVKGEIITSCHIIKIKKGNLVLFHLNGIDSTVKAKAIIREGKYIDLFKFREFSNLNNYNSTIDSLQHLTYKGKDYAYYLASSNRVKKRRRTGMVLTLAGLGGAAVGTLIMLTTWNSEGVGPYVGVLIVAGGLTTASVGIPIWIIGSAVYSKNKKAMEMCRQPKLTMGLGITNDGVGIFVNF